MRFVEKSTGLLIGIPTLGRGAPVEWSLALSAVRPPMNFNCRTAVIKGRPIAEARIEYAKAAIKEKAEFLFLIGDDTAPPGHALQTLIYRMRQDPTLGVVGGIYCSKSEPPAPLVFRGNGRGSYWDWKIGEFFEVDGIGMDCTLIRTEVFNHLSEPWFKTIYEDQYLEGIPMVESWTEDLYFCKKVIEETDYRIFADSMVMADHWHCWGENDWQVFRLRSDSPPMQRIYGETHENKLILDLGCGPVHWNFGNEGKVIRVDIREECEPDWRGDVTLLPFGNEEFDIVFSSHTLEHIPRDDVDRALNEWVRVLKQGGEIRLILPNIAWAADRIKEGIVNNDVLNVLYGSQEYKENFHRVGFTPKVIAGLLEERGLEVTENETDGYNILIKATKPVKEMIPEDGDEETGEEDSTELGEEEVVEETPAAEPEPDPNVVGGSGDGV